LYIGLEKGISNNISVMIGVTKPSCFRSGSKDKVLGVGIALSSFFHLISTIKSAVSIFMGRIRKPVLCVFLSNLGLATRFKFLSRHTFVSEY
jgi:hypothetical protein